LPPVFQKSRNINCFGFFIGGLGRQLVVKNWQYARGGSFFERPTTSSHLNYNWKGPERMQRPTAVTVLGIMNFVFAGFGVIGVMASIALFTLSADSNNSLIKLIHGGPAYVVWLKSCIPLGLLSCAVLLADGVGLLYLKPWARILSIAYAIYAIVFTVVGLWINLTLMVQAMSEEIQPREELAVAGALGGPVSGTVGVLFWLIYPIVSLIFMFIPKVVATFRPSVPPQT
jgi:hypothetical protein